MSDVPETERDGGPAAWMAPGYPQVITDEWKRRNIDKYPWVKDYTEPLYTRAAIEAAVREQPKPQQGDSAKRLSDAPTELGVERCGAHPAGWVSVEDRMPEAGTTCLVWSLRSWEKAHSAKIDTWDEQREAPVPFSSHTIPIGLGWDEHDDFYSVTHWMPLPSAPLPDATVTQGHSHGSEQDGPNSGSGSEKNA